MIPTQPINQHVPAPGLNQVIELIVTLSKPERIFLISASFNTRLRENMLQANPGTEFQPGNYSLLILTEGQTEMPVAEQQINLLMKSGLLNVNISMMDIIEFNQQLRDKKVFAEMVVSNAMLYYEKPDQENSGPGGYWEPI